MATGNSDTYTTNYNLIKPGYSSAADIDKINSNMDTIDSTIKGLSDKIAKHDLSQKTGSVAIASLISALSVRDVVRYYANPSTVFSDLTSDRTMYYAVVTIYKTSNNTAQIEVNATSGSNVPQFKRGYYEDGNLYWGTWT